MDELLSAYLDTLEVGQDTKRKVCHDVKEFLSLIGAQRPFEPSEEDYASYRALLQAGGKSEGVIRDSFSRVRKFMEYARNEEASASAVHEDAGMRQPADGNSVERKEARRFSLLVQPAMYEGLEWLSKYDDCSVARVITEACTEYLAKRGSDIDYIRDMMRGVKEGIARRKVSRA